MSKKKRKTWTPASTQLDCLGQEIKIDAVIRAKEVARIESLLNDRHPRLHSARSTDRAFNK